MSDNYSSVDVNEARILSKWRYEPRTLYTRLVSRILSKWRYEPSLRATPDKLQVGDYPEEDIFASDEDDE